MMNDKQWKELATDHEIAYLRADICLGSPESYSLDEKRQICEDMAASTAEVDEALRKDFESLPSEGQAMMLDFLQKADPNHYDWWLETLVGAIPDSAEVI